MIFDIYPDALKTYINIKTCTKMYYMETLFTIIKTGSNKDVTQEMKR